MSLVRPCDAVRQDMFFGERAGIGHLHPLGLLASSIMTSLLVAFGVVGAFVCQATS